MTAMAWAAMKGHKQVVDVLLKAGANPDIPNHVCLFMLYNSIINS